MSKPLYIAPQYEAQHQQQVRLEPPKIGCIPVRPFLIITSLLAFGIGTWFLITYLSQKPDFSSTHVQLGFGITFHVLVIIGSANYCDVVLRVCEVICIISMVLCAIAALLTFASLNITVIIIMQIWVGIVFGVNYLEYTCISRLRKYIEERRGIESMA